MDGRTKKKKSYWSEVWRRLKKSKVSLFSLFVVLFIVLVAIFAPFLAPHSYEVQNTKNALASPSAENLLGTDRYGRDTLSRLIYGASNSLQMGVFSVFIGAAGGIVIGSIAGYYGKWVDELLMRFLDIYQGIPMFLLAVTLAAVLEPGLKNAIIAVGVSLVPMNARFMRACILTVREMEYIEAAHSINASNTRIIIRHILPNAVAPMIVLVTMSIGMSILTGAGLSFIGLGAQPPTAEWGVMISDARNYLRGNPQLALYPGVCIMITVLAFNLFGDGLRDALDPRLKN